MSNPARSTNFRPVPPDVDKTTENIRIEEGDQIDRILRTVKECLAEMRQKKEVVA